MAHEYDDEGNPVYPRDYPIPSGPAPSRNDEDIKKDVESFLFYDDLVKSYQINIDVHQGVVTLSGTVSDEATRRAAIDDALKVFGVVEVRDNLELSQEAGL